jgi:hypothetical protein
MGINEREWEEPSRNGKSLAGVGKRQEEMRRLERMRVHLGRLQRIYT